MIELNEAFADQSARVPEGAAIDRNRHQRERGAIALGHPFPR